MEKFTKRTHTIQCTVNDYRAPVRWFRDDVELREDDAAIAHKYEFEKSILGHCKLTIRDCAHADAGLYKCKIDNTKHVTKCSVSFKGSYRLNS